MEQPLRTLLTEERIQSKVNELGRAIEADFPDEAIPLWLIGTLKGAAFFLADLARSIRRDVAIDFVQTRSYGAGAVTSGEVESLRDLRAEIAGCDVVLVEDIVDTGLTAAAVLDDLRTRAPRSLKLASLLDKSRRRRCEVRIDYRGFELPDEFVVGYGLDYAEKYRNLRDICVLSNYGNK